MSGGVSSRNAPFLVVAYSLPGRISGTPVVISRLLENFEREDVVLIGRPLGQQARLNVHYPVLSIPTLPTDWRGQRYWRTASVLPGVLTGLRAIRRYRLRAILGIYPDEGSLLTAYLLHRLTGLPWIPYFFDLYQENVKSGWQGHLARWLQPRVFRSASLVLALTGGMADLFRERYQIEASLVPHCINQPIPTFSDDRLQPKTPVVIGYTGDINAHRIGAMQYLVEALRGRTDYEIHYFTPQPKSFLVENGLWCENARQTFTPSEAEFIQRLQQCDVFYLPLTFDPVQWQEHGDQLLTSFPTKSCEYLVSQRPILVHCPDECFVAQFYRQYDCGLVVAEPGAPAIAQALDTLRTDREPRERLVRHALQAAGQFQGQAVAANLRNLLNEICTVQTKPSSAGALLS